MSKDPSELQEATVTDLFSPVPPLQLVEDVKDDGHCLARVLAAQLRADGTSDGTVEQVYEFMGELRDFILARQDCAFDSSMLVRAHLQMVISEGICLQYPEEHLAPIGTLNLGLG